MKTPVTAQALDHLRGHRHLAIPAPFAINYTQHPAFAVDVLWAQPHCFTLEAMPRCKEGYFYGQRNWCLTGNLEMAF
jgi:hypothetical protein